jgi:hypothetical protein
MDDQSLWKLMRETLIKVEKRFNPAIKPIVFNSSLSMRDWMLLLAALTFEPEDTTASHLMVRGPYTSSDRYLEGLDRAAELGYLDQVTDGRFRLSGKGRTAVQEFIDAARTAMASSSEVSREDLIVLAGYLERLVSRCLETPPPPDTWSITLSSKLLPPIEPPMPYIEQAISCLTAYRDDAHLAAWCSSGLSASALESLTLIWRGQVSNLRSLLSKLDFRGHPESVYLDALSELRDNGYISGSRSHIKITNKGREFRDQVESNTESYFFKPWECLSQDEKTQIAEVLQSI